ncbi:MAG: DUF2800 domain-containing protein [Oscillospiraceae bacterium]|nr:DUF2800 domain-containing protein [Oscillospiraceae bacterium]MBQ9249940.1 DUF2800 domain-containing protein [Oscillospiraceae bacterium]
MPSKHAKLPPSSAERWINCPGSVALADQLPPPGSSTYADEGTLAHAAAELKLRRNIGEITPKQYEKELAKLQESEYWCGEMDEATDFYADTVMEHLAAAGADAELLIEQHFSLDRWVPESFGTSDAVVIGGHTIEVIDLKYGKGVKVSAIHNPQLRLYGLGASALFGDLYDFDQVKETIIQPRLDHVSTEELALSELLLWAEEDVKPRALMAINGTDYMACGDWCRWCPAKAICRKRAEYNLEIAKDEFKAPPLLTDEEIGEVLTRAEQVKKWTEDIQAWALEQALAGKHFDGWKLVEGRSIRKYADDLKVAEKLVAAGYDEAMLYERKLYGITAMEKIVGKKKLTTTLGDLLVKPAGKPVLVPESDKREAINTTEAAKADFDDNTTNNEEPEALPFN